MQRNFVYPIAMIILLAFTIITVFIVLQNTIELLIGLKALPISTRVNTRLSFLGLRVGKQKRIRFQLINVSFCTIQQFTLGISSLSKLGPFGAALEVTLILYLTVTSTIGLYTIPTLSKIQPKSKSTPFVHIIANCGLLLILSSALPLLSKILGLFYDKLWCRTHCNCIVMFHNNK